jgi:hypothetical protein
MKGHAEQKACKVPGWVLQKPSPISESDVRLDVRRLKLDGKEGLRREAISLATTVCMAGKR